METKYFTIKNYPNDIYSAVGQIIKNAQEWEIEYKKLAELLDLPVRNIGRSSLNKLNEALKKNNMISKKEYDDLKEVIKKRNYINHEFYLTDFQKEYGSFEQKIEELEKILNVAQFLIFEATDVIDNIIDKIKGNGALRPTVFDLIYAQ